jgi:hypothetical protein
LPSGLRGGDFLSSSDKEPKRSSAVGPAVGDVFLSIDMASDRIFCKLDRVVSAGSRNGFRDTGRGGGSSKGDDSAGDMARLRKGLLEERLSVRPADRCSVCSGWVAAIMTNDAGNANGLCSVRLWRWAVCPAGGSRVALGFEFPQAGGQADGSYVPPYLRLYFVPCSAYQNVLGRGSNSSAVT